MSITRAALPLLSIWLVGGCTGGDDAPPVGPPVDGGALAASEVQLEAVTWNVGNPSDTQDVYGRRIRSLPFEGHMSERLAEIAPDIVALQEVLSPHRCAGVDETDPARTCFGVTESEPPVRRLLGSDYSVVCDHNQQSSCIGVHVGFGQIRGVERGELALKDAETPRLPFPKCSSTECAQESGAVECLEFTNVSSVLVDTDELGTIRVVNVHLHPWGPPCRWAMLRSAFALVDDHPTLMMGDWNFESKQTNRDVGTLWAEQVGEGRRFTDHHPTDAQGRAILTVPGRSIDRVITDFARGQCEVRSDPPLHAGFDFTAAGTPEEASRQPDHMAVICPLGMRAEPAPDGM